MVFREREDCDGVGQQVCFLFQAEDGIRDAQESRGLGDVYKRQAVSVTPFCLLNDNPIAGRRGRCFFSP